MSDPFNPAAVGRYADALPPRGANEAGAAARNALVHRIKRGTPGRHSGQSKGLFRDIFFPATGHTHHDSQAGPLTGLDDGFFEGFAVSALCQRMQAATRELRPQLVLDRINADLADRNRRLRSAVAAWYATLLTDTVGPVRTALAAFTGEPARREALGQYVTGLTSATWINQKLSQDRLGNWPDRDWELYHHWVKLLALGASAALVDDTIAKIHAGGLAVPPELGPGTWRTWSKWWAEDIGGWDLTDATGPILATTYLSIIGQPPVAMSEGNSFEFTANGMPGRGYRELPKSSCLAPGTKVVRADGSLADIETLRPGDQLLTPAGPRAVALVSSPLRAGRTLVRFAGTGFAFAPAHPFALYGPEAPAYAAADPARLARDVPTLAQFGIRPLGGPDPAMLVRHTPTGGVPEAAPAVVPAGDVRPDRLYDLFLEVGEDGRSEYFAGDATTQFLVASEAPRFSAAPETAEVMLGVLAATAPTILGTLAGVSEEDFPEYLSVGLQSVGRTLMSAVGPHLLPADAEPELATTHARLAEQVTAFARDAGGADPDDRQRLGILVQQLAARFAGPFQAAIALGWRRYPADGSLLAVTVHGIETLTRPGPDASAVQLELSRDEARITAELPVRSNRYYHGVDAVAYFSQWRAIREPAAEAQREQGWTLRVRLAGDPGVATFDLPHELNPGYEATAAPLIDPDGTVAGRVSLDLRALGPGDLVAEVHAKDHWDPSLRPTVARQLRDRASAYIISTFPSAIEAYGARATARAGAGNY